MTINNKKSERSWMETLGEIIVFPITALTFCVCYVGDTLEKFAGYIQEKYTEPNLR